MVVHHGKCVAYLRVSTDKQGANGYGIDRSARPWPTA